MPNELVNRRSDVGRRETGAVANTLFLVLSHFFGPLSLLSGQTTGLPMCPEPFGKNGSPSLHHRPAVQAILAAKQPSYFIFLGAVVPLLEPRSLGKPSLSHPAPITTHHVCPSLLLPPPAVSHVVEPTDRPNEPFRGRAERKEVVARIIAPDV